MLDKEVKRGSMEILILDADRREVGRDYGTYGNFLRISVCFVISICSIIPLLIPDDKKALNEHRQIWSDFFAALDRVAKINPA